MPERRFERKKIDDDAPIVQPNPKEELKAVKVPKKKIGQEESAEKQNQPILAQITALITATVKDISAGKGRGSPGYNLDKLLELGKQNEADRKFGSVVAKREPVTLTVSADAVKETYKLKRALDEAATHDEPENLSWG